MMRGEVDDIANTTPEQAAKRVTDELIAKHAPTVAILSHSKRAAQKQVVLQDAQRTLRETIAWWASLYDGADQSEMYRRFNFAFGIDVLSAQKQDAEAMIKTTNDINNYIVRKMTA
jgi:phosphoribosylaminoimidazole (AIR) synthetase